MRKITRNLCVFLFACACSFAAMAQTYEDVTDSYLSNAGFNNSIIYDIDADDNLGTASGSSNPNCKAVEGWTLGEITVSGGFAASASYAYGTSAKINALAIPTVGYDGITGGTLAIVVGWGASINYYQEITLPAGKYKLEYAGYNINGNATQGASKVGWVSSNESILSGKRVFNFSVWETESLEFTLFEETTGRIQVGLEAISDGSGANATVCFDHIKLYALTIDKTVLENKIQEAKGVVVVGSLGETYINDVISIAENIYNNTNVTENEILQAIEDLEAAMAIYVDNSLSSLAIDGVGLQNFNAEMLNYTYSVAYNSSVPNVSGVASGVASGANVTISPTMELPGTTTITVTAGNNTVREYTIDFVVNYLAAWDGNDTDRTTPGEAGWLSPNNITWNALNTGGGRNCYRDGLATGGSIRALVGSVNNRFAYPLSGLTPGKVYTFTCAYKWISDGGEGEGRRWTFGANTSIDGDEATMLNKVTGTVNSTGSVGTATFSFVYSGETPIYLVWNGSAAAYAIDNLLLVESGNAIKVVFVSNGGNAIEDKYVLEGGVVTQPENPSKEGYTFMGWYSDVALTIGYNFSESVTSDVTLYAKWESESIEPSVNLIAGWNGNDTDKTTPGEAGWLSPNDITWNALNTAYGRNCYRDGLVTGGSVRALVGSPNNKFAYPLSDLTPGKVYTFTCAYKYVSDGDPGEARRWTFGANTSIDGDEATMLNKVTGTVNSTGSVGTATFSFVYSGETPIYLVWNGSAAAYAIDNLLLVEAGDAVDAITITAEELPSLVNGALLTIEHLTLEGSFTSGDINTLAAKLAGNKVLTTVDLINASIDVDATDIFVGLNNNALKYFVNGATVPTEWTNAVVGNTADEIVLKDGAPFNNIKSFDVASISYTRIFASGWSTFCLPFSIDDISNLGTIEEFDEVKENSISFVTANSIEANIPYLINTDAAEKEFFASNVEVPVTNPQTGIFNATFKTLPKEESTGKFILVEEDGKELFLRASVNATIPAFRAYISMPNNDAPRYSVMHDGESGTTNITEIASGKDGLDIYSSNGGIVITATVAQQVTITGIDGYRVKTVVLAVDESTTINNLAAGIYLVNNQKVVVR